MLQRRQFLKFSASHSPAPAPSIESYYLHVSRPAMACRFEVTLPTGVHARVSIAQEALAEVDRLEQQLTIFKESSEVSLLNHAAAARAVTVSPSLFELLSLCQALYRETGGAFDITSGPLSRCWGFMRRQGRIPESSELEKAKSVVGGDQLLLDRETHRLRFARPGVEINLGAIGKGYALDRIRMLLQGRVRAALLSAGSSSLCAIGNGVRGETGWTVGIRHPRHQDRRLAVLKLRDASLATSGDEEQFFEYNGKRYGHIIDPRSGEPAQGVTSVTVVTRSAAVADALATAFYVGGRELAERYCATHPEEVVVVMLEAGSEQPTVLGNNHTCDVEIINE